MSIFDAASSPCLPWSFQNPEKIATGDKQIMPNNKTWPKRLISLCMDACFDSKFLDE
jgi:hypothetical protein